MKKASAFSFSAQWKLRVGRNGTSSGSVGRVRNDDGWFAPELGGGIIRRRGPRPMLQNMDRIFDTITNKIRQTNGRCMVLSFVDELMVFQNHFRV